MDLPNEQHFEIVFPSEFRQWCVNKWYEHKEELQVWEGAMPKYDSQYFFSKNKWFLKNLYRQEKRG
jgi:hypothetical protein